MSKIRTKIAAIAVAALAVAGTGGAIAATAGTASAATPSCGVSCPNVFSYQFGHHSDPAYAVDVLKQGEKVGQPVILFRTANYDPALDWTDAFVGTTADFFAAGLVSSAVALRYGCVPETTTGGDFPTCTAAQVDDPAFELEYSPFGVASGLCAGVAATAFQNEGVSLQPCGVSSKSVWIIDIADSPATITHDYVPVINGSDTNFSHPYVLTYPANSVPTDKPRPQLVVQELTGESNGTGPVLGTVQSSQLWGEDTGVLP